MTESKEERGKSPESREFYFISSLELNRFLRDNLLKETEFDGLKPEQRVHIRGMLVRMYLLTALPYTIATELIHLTNQRIAEEEAPQLRNKPQDPGSQPGQV